MLLCTGAFWSLIKSHVHVVVHGCVHVPLQVALVPQSGHEQLLLHDSDADVDGRQLVLNSSQGFTDV